MNPAAREYLETEQAVSDLAAALEHMDVTYFGDEPHGVVLTPRFAARHILAVWRLQLAEADHSEHDWHSPYTDENAMSLKDLQAPHHV